jgi:glutamate synthase (NADPH/NADH) large chain
MNRLGLYDPWFEHDACGVGFVVNVNGQRSHQIVTEGITILKNLTHRGAVGGDSKTGDGAGMLVQTPHLFFAKECARLLIALPQQGSYGAGMLFLPQDTEARKAAAALVEAVVAREGGCVLGWRDVPVQPDVLGETARGIMPHIAQLFVAFGAISGETLERRLYLTRKTIENAARRQKFTNDDFYIASFSCTTVVYKGLFVAPQFDHFYPDHRPGLPELPCAQPPALQHQHHAVVAARPAVPLHRA